MGYSSEAMDDPEFEMAAACCRWSFSGDARIDLRKASENLDWPRFMRLVRRHRIQGIAARALQKHDIEPPATEAAVIATDANGVAERNLRSTAESGRLLKSFSKAGLETLFLKGLTLSVLAYGDPFAKEGSDIDLLVDADAVKEAAVLLEELGYRPSVPEGASRGAIARWHRRHKESLWYNSARDTQVDLHSRLSDNIDLIPAIGLKSPHRTIEITRSVKLPTLTDDDLFAYLCVHGASSAWFRLKWASDFAGFVHRAGPQETQRLYHAAKERRAERAPAQALLLVDRLFDLALTHSLRQELRSDKVSRLLASIAFRELHRERPPTQRPLGTLFIHLTQPLLRRGWNFKFSEVARQVRDMVQDRALRA